MTTKKPYTCQDCCRYVMTENHHGPECPKTDGTPLLNADLKRVERLMRDLDKNAGPLTLTPMTRMYLMADIVNMLRAVRKEPKGKKR